MPKKSGSRPGNVPADTRGRRPARQARPSAAVPVGSEAPITAPPTRAPASGLGANSRRPVAASSRIVRPVRAGGISATADYGYVFADLKRIGMLAAAAFAVLIGLTFVVH